MLHPKPQEKANEVPSSGYLCVWPQCAVRITFTTEDKQPDPIFLFFVKHVEIKPFLVANEKDMWPVWIESGSIFLDFFG